MGSRITQRLEAATRATRPNTFSSPLSPHLSSDFISYPPGQFLGSTAASGSGIRLLAVRCSLSKREVRKRHLARIGSRLLHLVLTESTWWREQSTEPF